MLNFIVNENGRAEAEQGYHDDLVIGLAITYYIRTQQSYNKVDKNPQYIDVDKEIDKIFGKSLSEMDDEIEVF